VPFTLRNIKEDLEDIGSAFDGAPDLEFRAATRALELEESGMSYQRLPPGYRFPYGHTHRKQASRSSSSARPTSARIRAKTSMGSATGGLIRRAVERAGDRPVAGAAPGRRRGIRSLFLAAATRQGFHEVRVAVPHSGCWRPSAPVAVPPV
jgi:hypothetical protein